jgi:hypothetical protein
MARKKKLLWKPAGIGVDVCLNDGRGAFDLHQVTASTNIGSVRQESWDERCDGMNVTAYHRGDFASSFDVDSGRALPDCWAYESRLADACHSWEKTVE